jgi:hypothetical protein
MSVSEVCSQKEKSDSISLDLMKLQGGESRSVSILRSRQVGNLAKPKSQFNIDR